VKIRDRIPIITTAVVALAIYVTCGLHFDGFFSLRVFFNLLSDNSFVGVMAVGLTFVILTGGIDLSVGSMVGFSGIAVAVLISKHNLSPLPAIGLVLLFGALFGAGQGTLIARLKLPPFLVTLAGLFCLRGLALTVSTQSIDISHPQFQKMVDWAVMLPGKASITLTGAIFIATILVGSFIARQTRYGRAVYAIGGNAASAELLDVPVKRTLVTTYALSGFCAALGGAVFTLYTSSGNAISGTGMELDGIAAVVIGGTLLSGGAGSVFGTLLGTIILGLVQTAISFQGTLSSWWTKIFIGFILLCFLLLQKGLERTASRALASR